MMNNEVVVSSYIVGSLEKMGVSSIISSSSLMEDNAFYYESASNSIFTGGSF